MKIIFISDIHGMDKNLHIIEEEIINKKIDRLICLGDIYSGYYNKESVKEFLNKYKNILICMEGNCDSPFDIKESDFPIYPGISYIEADGIKIYITHGNKYNIDRREGFDGDILVYGHKHTPYIKKIDNQIFICVGSISFPRDEKGCSYMIYENKEFLIYDIDKNVIDGIKV